MYYHCSTEQLGGEFTFTEGGYYEKVTEYGAVEQMNCPGGFAGFKHSEIPELSASKSPEAAVFAQTHNIHGGRYASAPMTLYVYQIEQEPDVEINALIGDFALLEEVRYRHPNETPIHGELAHTVTMPPRAINDVELTYLPDGPYAIEPWGKAVKEAIAKLLNGNSYPDAVENTAAVTRPQADSFRQHYPA